MKICMIGTGYVGLVSGTCFAELGNNVICVDIDKEKINKLNNGNVPIYEPGLEELILKNYKQKRLKFSTDLPSSIKKSDIIFICVGTPTTKKNNQANLKYVYNVSNIIKKNINKYKSSLWPSNNFFLLNKLNNKKRFSIEIIKERKKISTWFNFL